MNENTTNRIELGFKVINKDWQVVWKTVKYRNFTDSLDWILGNLLSLHLVDGPKLLD